MKKERILFFDNFKGILIILVVLAHYFFAYYNAGAKVNMLVTFIYLFHMPAFMFVSGYLTSKNPSKESFYKLLLYYLIFNTLMMIYCAFFRSSTVQFINSYNSYWYLLALLIMRLLVKKVEKVKFIVPISIVISFLCSFYTWYLTPISKAFVLFPFFIVGYKLDKNKVSDFINNRNYKTFILGLVLGIIALVVGYYIVTNVNFKTTILTFSKYSTLKGCFYRAVIFSYSVLMIIVSFFLIPNKKLPFISNWGRNSICIYVIHRFFTLIFLQIFPKSGWSYSYIIYGFLATVITLLLLGSTLFKNYFDKTFDFIIHHKKPEKMIFIGLVLFILLMLFFQII